MSEEATVETTTAESTETVEKVEASEVSTETVENTENSQEASTETESTKDEETSTEKEETDEAGSMQFLDKDITINDLEIPDDLRTGLEEKGFKVDDLAKELYSGEFGLSDETKEKLYEVYGKYVVDSAISSITNANELYKLNAKEIEKQATENSDNAWKETVEILGSEEGWDNLTSWAEENLQPEVIEQINEVMENGNWASQKLIIKGMHAEYLASQEGGEKKLELTDLGSNSKGSSDEGALSYAEYNQLLRSGEYSKMSPQEQAVVDNRRRLGQQKGI